MIWPYLGRRLRVDWTTPRNLFEFLDQRFHFTLDPCSTHENSLCAKQFTLDENGLLQDWSKDVVFMNLPYDRVTYKWVRKVFEESRRGATVVCLLKAATDARYFHEFCLKGEIRFIRDRLYFGNGNGGRAPFPSMIVIFRPVSRLTVKSFALNEEAK